AAATTTTTSTITTTSSSVGSVDAYTPHLKRVLKSYRAAATTSLHGPNNVRWSAAPSEEKEEEDDSLSPLLLNSSANSASESTESSTGATAAAGGVEGTDGGTDPATGAGAAASGPGRSSLSPSSATSIATRTVIAQQPPPLLLPLPTDRKSSGQRSSTLLEGELIASFNVGGEERLCLPQIFNTVLRNFSLQQIYAVCDDVQIYYSQCTADQLAQLKEASILPFSVPSCGLIRRSDAERVCSLLLHVPVSAETPRQLLEQLRGVRTPDDLLAENEANGIAVYHECFGGCQGLVFTELYVTPVSPCVQCRECRGYLSPRNFVSHVHRARAETRTCHWGFSSANWRQYLLRRDESDECAQQKLESFKIKFDKRKKRPSESCKSITSGSTQGSLAASPVGDYDENFNAEDDEDKSDELCMAKKQRFIEDHEALEMSGFPSSMEHPPHPLQPHQYPFVSLGVDPTMWYQWAASAARTSAFKPWQTDLCGILVGSGKAAIAPGTSSGLPRAAPASPTHASKSTHKLIVAGHSNSLDSAEDALSCTSSASERVGEPDESQAPGGVQSYLGDLSGLQRVLEHHKLDCKVQKDVLHETMKIVYEYQQVVTSLVKQKHILEKELAHRLRADERFPGLVQVKQEPMDEQADQIQRLGSLPKKTANVSSDPKSEQAPDPSLALIRESQSLLTA
ncbi:ski oncogene, partial [Galendromus occidentalis]|uniref:Ski oncogene n=1 Tax=Galendromus occidentalis TaxID=34638 RepID=A0AAJ6QPS7_9ACAR